MIFFSVLLRVGATRCVCVCISPVGLTIILSYVLRAYRDACRTYRDVWGLLLGGGRLEEGKGKDALATLAGVM